MTPSASSHGLRLLAHHDLGGHGDGMQVVREGDALYVGHTGTTGMGTSILDVSDPAAPVLAAQWPSPPNSHTHKVQVADRLLLVNHERFPIGDPTAEPFSAGLAVYDLTEPLAPERIGFWASGGLGVHRVVWTGGRHAHMSATPPGFSDRIWVVLEMSAPDRPREVARWWWPGQGEGETARWPRRLRYAAHHALIAGDRAYLGFDDANMVILDVADMTRPRQVAHVQWPGGGSTHTCLPLPGRGLVVVTDEQVRNGPDAPDRVVHIVDVSDETDCRVLGRCPPPPAAFKALPLRFGAHNLHENRSGSYRSERLVFVSYFSAGVRVYDLADPVRPVEIAHWVPEPPPGQPVPQTNDLFVDREGLVWATDRIGGGLSVLEPEPWLAAQMAAARLEEPAAPAG
ncbi:MAG: LVIVD repeat-containing protein [Candidatus Dormibacteraceae bacterium]